MLSQELPRGNAPEGAWHSAKTVGLDFFEPKAEEKRNDLIKASMPFLYNLIHSMLEHANAQRESVRQARKNAAAAKSNRTYLVNAGAISVPPPLVSDSKDSNDEQPRAINDGLEAIEGIERSVSLDPKDVETARLAQVCDISMILVLLQTACLPI